MQLNKNQYFIYEDEKDLMEENSLVINNTSGGTIIINNNPNGAPDVQMMPPSMPNDGGQPPYYEDEQIDNNGVDEDTLQTSIEPPVPDELGGGLPQQPDIQAPSEEPYYEDENNMVSQEIPEQLPNEELPQDPSQTQLPQNQYNFPQPYEDDFNVNVPQGPEDESMYYEDEGLPPQEDAQAQMNRMPENPIAGVPTDSQDPNAIAEPYYDDENPETVQQQMDPNVDPNTQQQDPNMAGMEDPYYEDEAQIDPMTGQPIDPSMQQNTPQIDPMTGQPVDPAMQGQPQIDPTTGQPMDPSMQGQPQIDPATGQPMDPAAGGGIDPMTGQPIVPTASGGIDPMTGQPIGPGDPMADPYTSSWTDEKHPEQRVGNSSEVTTGRPLPVEDISKITELKKINTQLMRVKSILERELDKSYNSVEEKLNEAIEYFRTIISNLDSYVTQIDDIIIKYKRFIVTILTQINILKKQELEEKK